MNRKLRQAYIRGMIDLGMILFLIGSIGGFVVYVVEKYFMWGGKVWVGYLHALFGDY